MRRSMGFRFQVEADMVLRPFVEADLDALFRDHAELRCDGRWLRDDYLVTEAMIDSVRKPGEATACQSQSSVNGKTRSRADVDRLLEGWRGDGRGPPCAWTLARVATGEVTGFACLAFGEPPPPEVEALEKRDPFVARFAAGPRGMLEQQWLTLPSFRAEDDSLQMDIVMNPARRARSTRPFCTNLRQQMLAAKEKGATAADLVAGSLAFLGLETPREEEIIWTAWLFVESLIGMPPLSLHSFLCRHKIRTLTQTMEAVREHGHELVRYSRWLPASQR